MDSLNSSSDEQANAQSKIDSPRVVGFVTGTLAEFALDQTLEQMKAKGLPFAPRVLPLNIAVAALMTTDWVGRKLELPEEVERVVLPGFCRGDIAELAQSIGVEVVRGPKDLRDLPRHYGQEAERDYGAYDIDIIAEINHVPQLSIDEVLTLARSLRADGADVIDLGCDPGPPFAKIADYVSALVQDGCRVSVDSLQPEEIVPAVEAGAELVLSVNSFNVDAVCHLDAEFVVIPDTPADLESLDRTVAKLDAACARYRIDPVLEPIGFGFAKSLERYVKTRERYPQCEMMMGIGNLTELTDADSAPINLVLLGFCQELGIRSVLTTQVIHWAATSVRECDLARRLVFHATQNGTLPKHLEPDLHLLRDADKLGFGIDVIQKIAADIRDRNFRIYAEDGSLHVLNRDLHVQGTEPFELFEQLGVDDPSHAFYLGFELSKAMTALTLDKNYRQDEALRWGFLTREEKSHLAKGAETQDDEGNNDASPAPPKENGEEP